MPILPRSCCVSALNRMHGWIPFPVSDRNFILPPGCFPVCAFLQIKLGRRWLTGVSAARVAFAILAAAIGLSSLYPSMRPFSVD